MDILEERRILADPRRRAALLRLIQAENPANEAWEKALGYGKWLFFVAAPVGLVLFGAVWPSRRLLTGFAVCLSLAGLALVLLPALIRRLFGVCSVWHKFRDEELTLGADWMAFSMRGAAPGLRGEEYVWRVGYADIKRLEYDRKLKTLRVVGRFDEAGSHKADVFGLPKGMLPTPRPERLPEGAVHMEFPLYFPRADELVEELERRSGVYVHPARRADDMADLRDLPGLRPEKDVVKPMLGGLAAFAAAFLVVLAWQGGWLEKNPYAPYPAMDAAMLGRTFGPGEAAVLDGVRITLSGAQADGEGRLRVGLKMENASGAAILLRTPADPQSNVRAAALTRSGQSALAVEGPEAARVLIEPGGLYELELLIACGEAEAMQAVLIRIDSDRWPPEKPFWREEYLGGTVETKAGRLKSNELVFRVEAEVLER